jgi:hypothetical protein
MVARKDGDRRKCFATITPGAIHGHEKPAKTGADAK